MSSKLATSVLDLVSMRPGESAGSAIARSVNLAQQRGAVGIHALLAGGTSRNLRTSLLGHAGIDWACRGGDEDDSGRQRWCDAAKPRTPGSGGTVRDTRSAVSGADRSGARTCTGRRLPNDAGAAKGFAAEWRRFSGSAGGVANILGAGEAGPSR